MKKVEKKKPGPKPTGKGELIGVRILPDLMTGLDGWIAKQSGELSRPEAIRQLLTETLKRRGLV